MSNSKFLDEFHCLIEDGVELMEDSDHFSSFGSAMVTDTGDNTVTVEVSETEDTQGERGDIGTGWGKKRFKITVEEL